MKFYNWLFIQMITKGMAPTEPQGMHAKRFLWASFGQENNFPHF